MSNIRIIQHVDGIYLHVVAPSGLQVVLNLSAMYHGTIGMATVAEVAEKPGKRKTLPPAGAQTAKQPNSETS